jgi:DNA-binding MarR family transcriptional regulator
VVLTIYITDYILHKLPQCHNIPVVKDNETAASVRARTGMTDLYDDFFSAEQEVNNLFRQTMDALLAAEKLTPPQFISVERLREMNRPCKMSELAESTLMSPAAMTGVVDRLADLDLVKRGFDKGDRRVILLTLTARGQQVLSRVDGKLQRLAKRFAANVSRADLDAAVRVRRKYAEFLHEALKFPQGW